MGYGYERKNIWFDPAHGQGALALVIGSVAFTFKMATTGPIPAIIDGLKGFAKLASAAGTLSADPCERQALWNHFKDYLTSPEGIADITLFVEGILAGRLATSGAKEVVTSEGAADTANLAKLKEFYRQLSEYGSGGVKELENGKIRFYDTLTAASTPGEMAGARFVREWDPATGAKRGWYETVDQAGTVRSVAPKPPTSPQNHLIFDGNGNYTGRR